MKALLETLCQANAPTGFEEPAVEVAKGLLTPLVDEVYTDRIGSVVGVKRCGKENARRVLLDAHLDEVGFIVMGHDEGFLRIAPLGGIDPRILPDRELTILTDPPRFGVVATKPPHVMAAGEGNKAIPIADLRVDVGLSQEKAVKEIPVGTPVVFREGCYALGDDRMTGKTMDDRSCFAILLETLKLLQKTELNVDVYVLGSCREETNSAGAMTAVYDIQPDLAVAVDVTFGKAPDVQSDDSFDLGGGPTIGIGPNMSHWMAEQLEETAKKLEIPYQLEIIPGNSGTNGWEIQVAREGIPTAVVSLPLNYMHTPLEVVSLADMKRCARLLAGFVAELGEEGMECLI